MQKALFALLSSPLFESMTCTLNLPYHTLSGINTFLQPQRVILPYTFHLHDAFLLNLTLLPFPNLPLIAVSQRLPHKLPLRKAQPPLTRLSIAVFLIYPRQQPGSEFLAHLSEVLAEDFGVLAVAGRFEDLV